MLGLKEKSEKIVQEEQEEQEKQEKQEKQEEKETLSVIEKEETEAKDAKAPATDTRFGLAEVLGKTQSGLMNEFYDYQIKEFMAKVGAFDLEINDFPSPEQLNSLAKIGVLEYSLTPFFYEFFKGVEKKLTGGVRINAVLDFPKGESSHIARLQEAKFAIRNGVDKVYLTLPSLSLIVKNLSKIKAQLIKISRICKNKLGLIIICDGDEDRLKKVLKMIESIKVERVILFGKNQKGADKRDLAVAKQILSNKKVFVYVDQENADTVVEFIALKADGVYLKNPLQIGKDLKEKFLIDG